MLSCETDCRRVSQQSIPSLSSDSTDSSSSLDTQRRVNRRPKPTKDLTSSVGNSSHSNRHVAFNMEAYQSMHPFASSSIYSYPSAALPLGYYNDPGAYRAAYPTAAYEEKWNKSRHYYGNQGIKVYEPIMPVPLAVTMEATMYDCEPNEFDYDDNIPLAYFQCMGQKSNIKQSIKGKTAAHKLATNVARIDQVATPSMTRTRSPSSSPSSSSSSTTLGLRRNHKSATNISHATSPGHKRNSEPLWRREDNVVESRRAANTALHHKRNLTPKETSRKTHDVVPCEPSPNSIKRFLAGISRFNTRSVKSNQ